MRSLLLIVAGFVGTLVVASRAWERPAARCLPLAYGTGVGLATTIAQHATDAVSLLEAVVFGLLIGAGGLFAIWIERDSK